MARFHHLLLVCTNEGRANDDKQRCGKIGGQQLLDRLKQLVAAAGLKGKVRVTKSGCLDLCAKGCAALAISADAQRRETWYTRLTPDDAEALFAAHIDAPGRLVAKLEQAHPPVPQT